MKRFIIKNRVTKFEEVLRAESLVWNEAWGNQSDCDIQEIDVTQEDAELAQRESDHKQREGELIAAKALLKNIQNKNSSTVAELLGVVKAIGKILGE